MSAPQDPSELSPAQAAEYWISSHDGTEHTVRSYYYQLQAFTAWCDEEGIETVGEITGWHFDQFKRVRETELAQVSLKGQMSALVQFVKYLERIEAVDDDFHQKVPSVTVEREEETSDVQLRAEDAKPLLDYFRDSTAEYGTPRHAVLEVLWNTGCRLGGLRALDLEDFSSEQQYLRFRHRPQSGTPLKNKMEGQRAIQIPETVCDVLDHYVARERHDIRDDNGRAPLFTTRQGRPSASWVRCLCYLATQPCVHMRCPHGNQRETCEYRKRNTASQCPSSRAPHHVRTGSITWHRNEIPDKDVVGDRVNADEATIRRYYDKAEDLEKLEERRREITEGLDL